MYGTWVSQSTYISYFDTTFGGITTNQKGYNKAKTTQRSPITLTIPQYSHFPLLSRLLTGPKGNYDKGLSGVVLTPDLTGIVRSPTHQFFPPEFLNLPIFKPLLHPDYQFYTSHQTRKLTVSNLCPRQCKGNLNLHHPHFQIEHGDFRI
jgi:hypothetical protein